MSSGDALEVEFQLPQGVAAPPSAHVEGTFILPPIDSTWNT